MKLKLVGLLLASAVIGLVSRLLVKLSAARGASQASTVKEREAVEAAIEEAVRRGGYRARPVISAPN